MRKGFDVSSLGANAICIKFDFVKTFFSFPRWPMEMALKGELVVSFHTGQQKVGMHCHYHSTVRQQYLTLYHHPYLRWRGQMERHHFYYEN